MNRAMTGDRALRVYFWLAFGITWGAGGLGLLVGAFQPGALAAPRHPLYLLAGYGPSIAGVIMAAATDGRAGAIGIPFEAEVSAEVALAALIVAGGGLHVQNTRRRLRRHPVRVRPHSRGEHRL